MRVLLINSVCKTGSTGKIAYDLYQQGQADGHEMTICYGRGQKISERNIYKFGLDWETYFHAGMTRITGLTGCYSPFSTRRLLRFISRFAPDVIHLHEPHAYFMNIGGFFKYIEKNNIPLIYTFHCEFAYTGKCGYAYECEQWKEKCGNCPHLREYPKSLLFDFTAHMYRKKKVWLLNINKLRIVTPSKWLADRARQSFLGGNVINVIHNGINTEVFCPREYQHLKNKHSITDEKIVLAVAPDIMSERKGGRFILELADKLKYERIRFVLIGVENLNEQFPSNVIALGRTENQQELAEYYSMADCFVICSKRENFPTTCIEAFCCGTPVVGFDTGGTAETVPHPYGSFCAYGNMDALASAVLKMLQERFDDGEIAHDAHERYASRVMYDKYIKEYLSVLELEESQ